MIQAQPYRDGDTRNVGGVTYTRQGGQWMPSTPSTPQIVVPRQPTPRTPEQSRIEQGQAEAAPLQAPRAANDLATGQQNLRQGNTGGVNYSDENSLRSQYQALPEVRNYQNVLPMVNAAMRAARGGAGDLQIVYAFAKVMDPGSVVREGETDMAQGTGGLGAQISGYLQSLRNGGRLTPEVRQRLLGEIQNRVEQYRTAYTQTRKDYWQRAERYNFDPQSIIGEDLSAAYEPGSNAPEEGGSWIESNVAVPVLQAGGQVTRTDPREGALATPQLSEGEADPLTGDNPNPRFITDFDRQVAAEYRAGIEAGWTREQFDRWARSRGLSDVPEAELQRMARDRATGAPITVAPRATGMNADAYREQSEAAAGGRAREEWAAENPLLASIDTVVRTGANAISGGLADRIAATFNGTSAATEHGITQQDWRDRPLETLGGTILGGSRLPYGTNLRQQIGLGTAYGGFTGFNEADGGLSDRLTRAYQGAAGGAGANALIGGFGRAFRAPNADDILAAGERQNVFIPRFMTGRETAQVATGAVGATPGRIPLAAAANRTIEGIETARNRAATEIGDVGDNFEAGRRAQSGAREFLDRSERRAAQLYDRIPIPPRTRADLTNARAALSEATEGLESNPRLSALLEDPRLIEYRDALAEGGLSWRDLKRFRTRVGQMIGRAQVASEGTQAEDLRSLYAGLTRDMEATAAAQGPRALTMFNRATQYWRGREQRREGIIQDILGRNFDAAPEDTFRLINRWAQRDTGNTTALAQTMRSLPRDDANAVRATIFARMGRATRGQQDETGEAFSPFVFATQWAGLEPRAKALLVPNASHRRNLDDIALLTSAMRRSERFTNTSNTGLGANLGMFTLGGMANLPAAAGAGGLTYVFGRLLATKAGSASLLRAFRNPESFSRILQEEAEEEDF